MINEKNRLTFFLACFLPVLFTMCWLLKNSQLPTSDATDYLMAAIKSYDQFIQHGFWQGHLVRGFRPVFYPYFTLPFLFLFQGDLFLAYQATALFYIVMSVIYIYLFFRLQLDAYSSMIATSLIGLLSFVQTPVLTFFSESALFPCLIATLYYLIRSDYFLHRAHTYLFIFFCTLSILIRPVEAVTHLLFVFTLFLFLGWRKQFFSLQQLWTVIAFVLTAAFIFLLLPTLHFLNHYPFHPIDGGRFDIQLAKTCYLGLSITLLLGCMAWIGVAFSMVKSNNNAIHNRPLVKTFMWILILSLLWFGPHSFSTFLWIFRTSIGDIAANTVGGVGQPWIVGLTYYLFEEGLIASVGIFISMLIAMMCLKRHQIAMCLSLPFMYLIAMLPFPIWEVFFTGQNTTRKLFIVFPALLMACLLFGLAKGRGWLIRFVWIAAILCIQVVFAFSMLFNMNPQLVAWNNRIGTYPKPTVIKNNPHELILQFLKQQAFHYQLNHIAIEVNIEKALPVDTFLLSLMAVSKHQGYKITYPYFSAFAQDNPMKLAKQVDAVFLSDQLNNMMISPMKAKMYANQFDSEKNPTLKTWYQFLMYYTDNQLDRIGWKLGPCLVVKANDGNDYQGCLLLKPSSHALKNGSMRL